MILNLDESFHTTDVWCNPHSGGALKKPSLQGRSYATGTGKLRPPSEQTALFGPDESRPMVLHTLVKAFRQMTPGLVELILVKNKTEKLNSAFEELSSATVYTVVQYCAVHVPTDSSTIR